MSLGGIISSLNRDIVSLKIRSWQRAYNWELLMPMVGAVPGELLAPCIQAIDYSQYSMSEAAKMRDGAYSRYAVGNMDKKEFTITFLETEEGIVQIYLNVWKNLMIDSQGLWKNKLGNGGYAKGIYLTYLTSGGIPLRTVAFINAWPLKFYEAKLDYGSNELVKLTIPFQCDTIQEFSVGGLIEQGAEAVFEGVKQGVAGLGNLLTRTPTGVEEGTGAFSGAKAPGSLLVDKQVPSASYLNGPQMEAVLKDNASGTLSGGNVGGSVAAEKIVNVRVAASPMSNGNAALVAVAAKTNTVRASVTLSNDFVLPTAPLPPSPASPAPNNWAPGTMLPMPASSFVGGGFLPRG